MNLTLVILLQGFFFWNIGVADFIFDHGFLGQGIRSGMTFPAGFSQGLEKSDYKIYKIKKKGQKDYSD